MSLGLSLPAAAQLDDSCTVSALNRTTPVQADGTWVLPNVPANQGPVRVRATCVENGVSRSGQSDFFTVPANGVIDVVEILFGSPEPIPLDLALTAPSTTLTTIGQTVQLAAFATYSDGSTADLTAGATGTGYRSSNPVIASVAADGLVTAHASGRVLLSALNEGALAVLQLQIVASGDSDGDGLPDDYEITLGLDPNDPVDALDDQDEDGLATIDEFQAGLHPLRADTDGDRLLDGEEGAFGTNPLLYDSDGDQVADGLEVLAGSDPIDPDSVDLGPILESLTVQPSSFTLIFNTAVGEASRRLDVMARLVDGTEIQARSRRYGTSYQSSDLSIASFGAEDGRVFAGRDGLATVTVTLGAHSDTALVNVETFSPTALSFLHIPGFANGVDVSGEHAYIAAGSAGLYIVDVADLTRPVITGFVDTPGNANDVRVSGLFAYVADGAGGLQIVDISDPVRPQIAGSVDTPGIATDLVVVDDLVYVADGTAGVRVIQATDPSAPVLLGGVDTPGEARGIDAVDHLVVVADNLSGIQIVDVSSPSSPLLLGSTHTRPNASSRAADVAVRGRLAYVADGAGYLGGLRGIDFSVPTTPVVVASTSDEFGLTSVALDGRFAVAADYYYTNAVPVFDIGAAPAFSAVLDFSRLPSFRSDNGNGIAVRDGVVFLVGGRQLMTDNGSLGETGLHIGRYRLEGDDLGVAPQVSITAPAAGISARERTTLAVQAAASDDVRVAFVEFLVDGVVISQDFKAPYQATVTIPTGTSFRLGARATDLGGNVGEAEEVVVAITPDNRPVVTLLSPVADLRIVEGTSVSVAAAASDDVRVDSVDLRVDGVSRRVAFNPPYRVEASVPVGATQIVVEAIARDNLGQTATTGPLVFAVADDPPPVVVIAAPGEGTQVVQGATTLVTAAASDDRGISQVRLFVDGQAGPTDGSAPYEFTVTAPSSGSEVRLSAQATDVLGQTATSPEVVLTLVPDPGTTVTGSVVSADGQPVAGATLLCRGVAATSGENGLFTVAGVPTLNDISCSAADTGPQGTPLSGTSALVPPVPEGITDVGPIVLTDSVFEVDNLGRNLHLGNDEAKSVNLPFAFSIFGRTYTRVFVHTNGLLTFGVAVPRDHTEDRTEFISGDHLGWPNAGPSIAVFWDHLYPPPTSSTNIGETDYYRFSGSQGDTIVAEVIAQRQGSSLDSYLRLFTESFIMKAYNDDFYGLDSRIEYTLPATGIYFLSVEDLNKWGGPTYSYQLLLQANGAPVQNAGVEVEPNDFIYTATPIAYGDRISGNIRALSSNTPKDVFVNDKLSGKLVVTWNNLREPSSFAATSNWAQVVLFSDGRIQIKYDGMTADDGLVGISPSTNGEALEVDFSEDVPFSAGPGVAVFEEFDGPVGTTGDDPPGDRPFDLDGRILIFSPNATGGYDVRLVGAPE